MRNQLLNNSDRLVLMSVVQEIFKAQDTLNDVYNVNWRTEYNSQSVDFAANGEFIELLEEVQPHWKFYGSVKPSNWGKALEEFIDVVHFKACSVLLKHGQNPLHTLHRTDVDSMIRVFDNSLSSNVPETKDLLSMVGKLIFDDRVQSFQNLLVVGCRLFDISPDHLLVAYLHKNRKNTIRASNGAASVDVDHIKHSELGTFEYMYQHGFLADNSEEYNERMSAYD